MDTATLARAAGGSPAGIEAIGGSHRQEPDVAAVDEHGAPTGLLWRAAGVAYFRAQMTRALDLMGIAVPPRM